ncbi:MAG: HU family DNA-binding protein [Firmicutes bacterium]|nr:HU family DNA-binding protein [Candidatus Colivicinus equi]
MTKNELVTKISEKMELTKKDSAELLDKFSAVIIEALAEGEEVTIPGVVKLNVVTVPERRGIVQMGSTKGSEWVKPEHKEPKAKIQKALKEIVQKSH